MQGKIKGNGNSKYAGLNEHWLHKIQQWWCVGLKTQIIKRFSNNSNGSHKNILMHIKVLACYLGKRWKYQQICDAIFRLLTERMVRV